MWLRRGGGSKPEDDENFTATSSRAASSSDRNLKLDKTPTSDDGPGVEALKRIVCDHCRRRRIRCDYQSPCAQCRDAKLTCKRDHVPRKRGPKRGSGRVIKELRAQEPKSRESSAEPDIETDDGPRSAVTSGPSSPQDISWAKVVASDPVMRKAPESGGGSVGGAFATGQYGPTSRSYHYLVPQCVELYQEHIYPIMPLFNMPNIQKMVLRPLAPSEKTFVYALSALTCFHMSGQSLQQAVQAPDSWESAGRFFLEECILTRQSYDFVQHLSLDAVISSFWLSTSFFEINQSRKSWYYLREALTLALELGLHDDSTYSGLSAEETLCRQRVFWQLFVTERSFAILRNKPITFKKTPRLPTRRHAFEAPDIHSGFLQLISCYVHLDESFVTAWNDGSDPRVSAATYLALQQLLARPPAFLSPSTPGTPPPDDTGGGVSSARPSSSADGGGQSTQYSPRQGETTTDIQKADLLITQQWLRIIVWVSSFRQGLLSWGASHESMRFSFPLAIAQRTTSILQSLPPAAIEVHGMGIFEKIFEIGTWCISVLNSYDSATAAGNPMVDSLPDMSIFGVGRKGGVTMDPLEFFVKTLSASPNSRTQFAERLLLFASERPGGMKMALSPGLQIPTHCMRVPSPSSMMGGVMPEVWKTGGDDIHMGGGDAGVASPRRVRQTGSPPLSVVQQRQLVRQNLLQKPQREWMMDNSNRVGLAKQSAISVGDNMVLCQEDEGGGDRDGDRDDDCGPTG
ncbi:hypothetical protein B0T17DRAFT_502086 [Bombardia bombarda]|uniref:Zn(2)-C6 fungal-type domain-containing protein n=1 Tax=Bombardia bombarda TaxID=252184 RepID=A0AA39XI42_9PEZI|nr:hypothetical protein B0T17DRAFT_502086 [Bombardia bombarda]